MVNRSIRAIRVTRSNIAIRVYIVWQFGTTVNRSTVSVRLDRPNRSAEIYKNVRRRHHESTHKTMNIDLIISHIEEIKSMDDKNIGKNESRHEKRETENDRRNKEQEMGKKRKNFICQVGG